MEWFNGFMTATVEQTQAELARLIRLAQQGEEVVITNQGRAVARLTGIPVVGQNRDRKAWLSKLARLRQTGATGTTGASTDQIIEDLRSERS